MYIIHVIETKKIKAFCYYVNKNMYMYGQVVEFGHNIS